MRPFQETDDQASDYNDTVIAVWNDGPPPGQLRVGPPCVKDGDHDWWRVPAAAKGIRELPDGQEHRYIDMIEHDECAWCGKWRDQAAYERQKVNG